jgi:hypothetical protein
MQYVTASMLQHRGTDKYPLIMDLLNEEQSPFIVGMQHFSTLLSLDHTRIQLFGYLAGCATAEELCEDVDRLLRLRSLIHVADAWLYARCWFVVNGTACM